MAQIDDVEAKMNAELKECRGYVKDKELFSEKFMQGSKLGHPGPPGNLKKNVLIICEASEKIAKYLNEARDEITKFVNNVIISECESFNLGVFKNDACTMWLDTVKSATGP